MPLSRQSLASIAQLLGTLLGDPAGILIYKHLGVHPLNIGFGTQGYLQALEAAGPDAVWDLVRELVEHSPAIRAGATPKYVFDGRLHELERWLAHDGWMVADGVLVRIAPAAEDATGVRDALIETLAASDIDGDGAIRTAIENSADAFVREPPDYNASVTNARIALETTARRAATHRAAHGGPPYPVDTWGAALLYLRAVGVLTIDEEQVTARLYTFISPAAHTPVGLTDEEWARLSRTFGLSACFFILRTSQESP